MMRGLTLWQPYAWAIPLFKDFENRDWKPPDKLIGHTIAIHAAVRRNTSEELDILAHWKELELPGLPILHPDSVEGMPRGAVTATARLSGWVRVTGDGKVIDAFAFNESVRDLLIEQAERSPHATGPFAWYLTSRRALKQPIPCRGWQRLWRLPPDVAQAVLAQYEGEDPPR